MLYLIVMIPIALLLLTRDMADSGGDASLRGALAAVAVLVALLEVGWISLYVSMRVRTGYSAVMIAYVLLLALICGPFLLANLLHENFGVADGVWLEAISLCSPIAPALAIDDTLANLMTTPDPVYVALAVAAHMVTVIGLRHCCTARFDRWLGRVPPGGTGLPRRAAAVIGRANDTSAA
jgi:hypothetical protein